MRQFTSNTHNVFGSHGIVICNADPMALGAVNRSLESTKFGLIRAINRNRVRERFVRWTKEERSDRMESPQEHHLRRAPTS
jgi:hypothetical protein